MNRAEELARFIRHRQHELADLEPAQRRSALADELQKALETLPAPDQRAVLAELERFFPVGLSDQAPAPQPAVTPELSLEDLVRKLQEKLAAAPEAQRRQALAALAEQLGVPMAEPPPPSGPGLVPGQALIDALGEIEQAVRQHPDPVVNPPATARDPAEAALVKRLAEGLKPLASQAVPVSALVRLAAGMLVELGRLELLARTDLKLMEPNVFDPVHRHLPRKPDYDLDRVLRRFVETGDAMDSLGRLSQTLGLAKVLLSRYAEATELVVKVLDELEPARFESRRAAFLSRPDCEARWAAFQTAYADFLRGHFGAEPLNIEERRTCIRKTMVDRVVGLVADNYGGAYDSRV